MNGKLGWLGITALLGLVGVACVGSSPGDGDDMSAPGAQALGKGNSKITICHVPPGNPAAAHEITISVAALQAHLNHGDVLGACGDEGEGGGDEGEGGGDEGEGAGDEGEGAGGQGGSTGGTIGLPIGSYCGNSEQCLSGACTDGACVDVAACVVLDSGDACSPSAPCCGDAHCITDGVQGVCYPAEDLSCVAPGAPCDVFADFCCWDLTCGADGTCQ